MWENNKFYYSELIYLKFFFLSIFLHKNKSVTSTSGAFSILKVASVRKFTLYGTNGDEIELASFFSLLNSRGQFTNDLGIQFVCQDRVKNFKWKWLNYCPETIQINCKLSPAVYFVSTTLSFRIVKISYTIFLNKDKLFMF